MERPSSQPQETTENGRGLGEKIFKFLEKTGFIDIRRSDEKFEQWLQGSNFESCAEIVDRLNGIVRGQSIAERAKGYSHMEVRGDDSLYLSPPVEIKGLLLKEVFEALKRIPNNDDRAALIYYSFLAIHPYSDGNGRTARLLSEIISTSGKTLSEGRLKVLTDHGDNAHSPKARRAFSEKLVEPEDANYYFKRELAKDLFGEEFFNKYGRISASSDIQANDKWYASDYHYEYQLPAQAQFEFSKSEQAGLTGILNEMDESLLPFVSLTLAKFFSEKGRLYDFVSGEESLHSNTAAPEDINKKNLILDGSRIQTFLETATLEELHRLMEINTEIKMNYIRQMIDVFENPEKHQTQTETNERIAVKEAFSGSIK